MSKSARLILATVALVLTLSGVTMLLRAYFLTTTETPIAESDDLPLNSALNVLGVNTNLGAASTVWGESILVSGLTLGNPEVALVQSGTTDKRLIKMAVGTSATPIQTSLAALNTRAIDVKFYGTSAFTYVLPLSLSTPAEVWGFDGTNLKKLYSAGAGVDITSAIFDPVNKFLYWVEVEASGNSSIYLQTARGEQNLIRTRIFGELVKLTYYDANSQLVYYSQGNKCFHTHTVKTDTLELPCTQLLQIGQIQNHYSEFSDPTKFVAGSGDKLWRFNYSDQTTQSVLALSGQQLISAYAAAGKYTAVMTQNYTMTTNGQIILSDPGVQLITGTTVAPKVDLPDGSFTDLQVANSGELYTISSLNNQSILWRWDDEREDWQSVSVNGCTTNCQLAFYP
jgi:hypothetical protein